MYERRRLTPLGTLFLSILISLFALGDALALFKPTQPEDKIGGSIRAQLNGKPFYFPSLKSDISAVLEGDLATVTIVQTFLNPTDQPLNASYLFPLNKNAAVHFMQMEVGDERITAVIKQKAEARATFEQAKRQGKAAALLNQHRPNMFVQELANLMPGKVIKVKIKYAMAVPRIDGAYELVVPLVVGPRFTPRKTPEARMVSDEQPPASLAVPNAVKSGQWSFSTPPAYPQVSGLTIPDIIAEDRVSIHVDLKAAFPIKQLKSATHLLSIEGEDHHKTAKLAAGRTIDNRDFVLRYELAGRSVQAGMLVHRDKRGEFFSLLVEPPKEPLEQDITPREMVFVLDTSGSMSGQPMEASKTFMRHAISSLRSTDYFRIIRFSSDTGEFSNRPVRASMLNKLAGIKYVNSLMTGGGTRVPAAIDRAFAVSQTSGTLRLVTFLSDGYIGNEDEVLKLIARDLGDARIFAFGVGTSVNRYLLAEMARMGRGFARFIDPAKDVNDAAIALARRLEAPLLTDIEVDWGELNISGITLQKIPDLFKGDSLRLMARSFDKQVPPGTYDITVKGISNGRKAIMPIRFTIPENLAEEQISALPLIWARSRITDHMRSLSRPRQRRTGEMSDETIRELVTKLGLDFSLMTQWTSFVAVSEKIVNEQPANSLDTSVPLNQVKGVSRHAYPLKQQVKAMQKAQVIKQPAHLRTVAQNGFNGPRSGLGAGGGFAGAGTPEPGVAGGMVLLVLMMLMGWMWSKKRMV
jgi:Ca-activated chloride channel family protein